MILLAIETHPPFQRGPGFPDHADCRLAAFQASALFDMNFDVSGNVQINLIITQITYGLQRILQTDAIAIAAFPGIFQGQCPGKYTAADQARLKAGALLVGPVDDGQIAGRYFTAITQLPRQTGDRHGSGKHAVYTVETTRARLAVQM